MVLTLRLIRHVALNTCRLSMLCIDVVRLTSILMIKL